jgi:hypothetical protein
VDTTATTFDVFTVDCAVRRVQRFRWDQIFGTDDYPKGGVLSRFFNAPNIEKAGQIDRCTGFAGAHLRDPFFRGGAASLIPAANSRRSRQRKSCRDNSTMDGENRPFGVLILYLKNRATGATPTLFEMPGWWSEQFRTSTRSTKCGAGRAAKQSGHLPKV